MRHGVDDLLESLREENEALLVRVAHLEATRDEYRRQMEGLLNSSSWRLTAPLRDAAAGIRLARRRIHRLPDRFSSRPTAAPLSPAGLFPPSAPPEGGLVTAASPLLAHPGPAVGGREPTLRRPRSDARVLVVAHVYYPEVWFDIEDRLVRIPEPHDLIVSLVDGKAELLEAEIRERLPHAMIHHVGNRGRDLGSLVELANAGLFDGYDAILKVHTKRSPHRMDGDAWRVSLLEGLLPSPDGIRRILELLRQDRSVGLVVPSGSLRGPETWGSNQVLVEALAARIPLAFDPDALRYPAGSMYWARPWLLRRLADLRLGEEHFEPEAGHVNGSTAHALERFVGVAAQASGLDIVDAVDVASRLDRAPRTSGTRPKVLAFYSGGLGTDWADVDGARALYEGHRQPAEPGELGRYDLSDPDVMRRQAALAAEYGVDGFVVRHRWRNLLDDPSIKFSFALCWANENDTLPGEGWADRFYDGVLPALSDPRCITFEGRPLLVLDHVGRIKNASAAIERWKERATADGLCGLHVLALLHPPEFDGLPRGIEGALDGVIRLPPLTGIRLQSVKHLAPGISSQHSGDVYSYDAAIDGAELGTTGPQGLRVNPGVMPGWDDTPRRGHGAHSFHGANPLSFRRWVARAADAALSGEGPALLFVNAWNEWAEGAHLEPDVRFGRGYLEALRDAIGAEERSFVPASRPREESAVG